MRRDFLSFPLPFTQPPLNLNHLNTPLVKEGRQRSLANFALSARGMFGANVCERGNISTAFLLYFLPFVVGTIRIYSTIKYTVSEPTKGLSDRSPGFFSKALFANSSGFDNLVL